jgi:hypothetical protein
MKKGRKVWLVEFDNSARYRPKEGTFQSEKDGSLYVKIWLESESGMSFIVVDRKPDEVFLKEQGAILKAIQMSQDVVMRHNVRIH